MLSALVLGGVVWSVLGGMLAAWLAVTTVARRSLPTVLDVGRWFLQCWLGRSLLLAGWAVAGWHLFCQRP